MGFGQFIRSKREQSGIVLNDFAPGFGWGFSLEFTFFPATMKGTAFNTGAIIRVVHPLSHGQLPRLISPPVMPADHRGLYQIKPHCSKGGGVFKSSIITIH